MTDDQRDDVLLIPKEIRCTCGLGASVAFKDHPIGCPAGDWRRAHPLPERSGREGDSQPLPTRNAEVDTQTLAMAMIMSRRELGIRRYGTALQPNNGRDSLWDAVEESLDMLIYLLNYWREQHPGEELPS